MGTPTAFFLSNSQKEFHWFESASLRSGVLAAKNFRITSAKSARVRRFVGWKSTEKRWLTGVCSHLARFSPFRVFVGDFECRSGLAGPMRGYR